MVIGTVRNIVRMNHMFFDKNHDSFVEEHAVICDEVGRVLFFFVGYDYFVRSVATVVDNAGAC